MTTNPAPSIFDAGKRAARTAVQVLLAFGTLAGVYAGVVGILGQQAGISGTAAGAWLAGSVVWVTAAAGIIARVMALPSVNALLDSLGLAGHSGTLAASDTRTRLFQAVSAAPAASGTD